MSLCATVVLTSCVEEQLATFKPGDTQAQVMGQVPGATLSADGEDLSVNFDEASFSVTSPVGYTLYVAASGSEEGNKLAATISKGTATFKQKDLNSTLLNLGATPDEEFKVDFWLMGYLCNDKGAAINGTEVKSNVVSATYVPYNADILDVDIYDHVWIIGAGESIGAWGFDGIYQFLYNYSKDGKTYEGVIDYGADAASGWKITGIAGWDDSCNWGSPDQSEESEAMSITLISAGSSKDIKCYSKRFYKWSFDKTSLELKKIYGFENVGIVGSFNEWNQADPNAKMEYNGAKHRFYIDYTFSDDAELKFTCDDSWDLNWGVGCAAGGDNIPVAAGSYRIYLDLNNMEYTFNAGMYGKEEPGLSGGGSEPKEEWSIIGTVGGTSWDTDFNLSEASTGVWKYNGLELTETDEFKIRFAHSWTTAVGGPEENATSNIDPANPYGVYKPEIGTAFIAGDKNIAVQVAGTYDVVYDTNEGTITISEHATGWALIGVIGETNWSDDFDMTQVASGVWTSPAVVINGAFKLRFNKNWDIHRGGTLGALDTPFAVENNGADINVPTAGETYVVTYYEAAEAISVHNVSTGWSLIGNINGGSWDQDVYMTEVAEGIYSASCLVNSDLKIRYAGGWDVNRGGSFAALDTPFDVTNGGDNIKLDEGYYTIVYNSKTEQITVSKTWSLIGGVFGSEWNKDFWMIGDGNGGYVYNNAVLGGEWKIRYDNGWDVNRGGAFSALGTPFTVENNGSNIASPGTGLYNVKYNPATEEITVSSAL